MTELLLDFLKLKKLRVLKIYRPSSDASVLKVMLRVTKLWPLTRTFGDISTTYFKKETKIMTMFELICAHLF